MHQLMWIERSLFCVIFCVIAFAAGPLASYAEYRVGIGKVVLSVDSADWRGTIGIPLQGAESFLLFEIYVEENEDRVDVKFPFVGCLGIRPLMDCQAESLVVGSVKALLNSVSACPLRLSPETTRTEA